MKSKFFQTLLVTAAVGFLTVGIASAVTAKNLRVNNEDATLSIPASPIPLVPVPIFSWELTDGLISSFTVTVSTTSNFSSPIWDYSGSTTSANYVNYITRINFNADNSASQPLSAGATYFLRVKLFESGASSATMTGSFITFSSALNLSAQVLDLTVDGNNPFNPAAGQSVSFNFTTFDRDRTLILRVYTLSGELVREWPEEFILRGATKVINWDGKSSDGRMIVRGVYMANLSDPNDDKSITKKIFVVNK